MIIGNRKDFARYRGINPAFARAFGFLETLSEDSVNERIREEEVCGGISVIAKSDALPDGSPKCFEAHRRDIDIHYVVRGEERFGFAHVDTLVPLGDYNEEKDYQFFTGRADYVTLRTGDFCVTFPEDAHIPCLPAGTEETVKKVILKIRDQDPGDN